MTTSPERPSRRTAISDAALELAARGGNHAVTHTGVDVHLGLPKGSTSYYFRTRHALVSAAIPRLAERSRADFAALFDDTTGDPSPPADLIARYLERLLTVRRTDVLARYALAPDARLEPEAAEALAACMFSISAATDLVRELGAPDPETAGRDLVTVLEGVLFDRTHGARAHTSSDSDTACVDEIRSAVALWLDALCAQQ
ncbi:TetR family transcriptional regulator [Rhodococcus sp. p52]|uniref:TetR/AcrR family transcriptional regulator n=1 Tax=Rhodococcus sp. p52 TaxID=935199 RepID=UPI0008245FE3|nr:TetR/AcrR family transcriptional regulator [Rhodococcus sp. p52]AOD22825.1 TetR family transcriptional regulator [Rhodococcus sp. p52]